MAHSRNDGHDLKLPVLFQPNIGLDSDVRHSVIAILNSTLADQVVLTTKTRCAHWNVRGGNFFELRGLFETQYQLLNNISDEIAERARMLGGFAIGSLEEFLGHTRLEEQPGDVPDILHLLADYETSVRFLREDARKCSEAYEDEGTFELLVSVMRLPEKMAWIKNLKVPGKKEILGFGLVVSVLMFVIGLWLEGRLFPIEVQQPLVALAALGQREHAVAAEEDRALLVCARDERRVPVEPERRLTFRGFWAQRFLLAVLDVEAVEVRRL